jgi:hypothetical protein
VSISAAVSRPATAACQSVTEPFEIGERAQAGVGDPVERRRSVVRVVLGNQEVLAAQPVDDALHGLAAQVHAPRDRSARA